MRIFFICLVAGACFFQTAARADEFNSAGVRIHYVVAGQGDPVILIHGLGASAAINWGAPGLINELSKRYEVIALDCRGHGLSDKPTAEGTYGTNMVEDVARLMDHLHIAQARVVGYSMGGMIGLKLAVMHPDRVTSLVLAGMGWPRNTARADEFWENIGGRSNDVPAACMHGITQLTETEDEIKSVNVPVTVIVGDRDICRYIYVEPLQRARPDWPVHVIAGAGHANCVFKPEFTTQLEAALEK